MKMSKHNPHVAIKPSFALFSNVSGVHSRSASDQFSVITSSPQGDKPLKLPPFLNPGAVDVDATLWDNVAVLVDKPINWTSYDVCGKIKYSMGRRRIRGFKEKHHKVGHAGTLDPLATGKSSKIVFIRHYIIRRWKPPGAWRGLRIDVASLGPTQSKHIISEVTSLEITVFSPQSGL